MHSTNIHIWKLSAALAIVSFLGGLIFLFLPYSASVYEKYSVLSSQKEQIQMMSNWQDQLADIEQKQQLINDGIQEMVVDIANENELSKIIEQFYSIAGQTIVSVSKIQPLDIKRENGYLIRNMQVDAAGSYHSLARFVNQLERSGMLVEIQSIDLEPNDDNSTVLETSLLLEITLTAGDGL